jgi:tetratricopeptide (TPR) repeat protein
MRIRKHRQLAVLPAAALIAAIAAGCIQGQLDQNRRQLAEQQAELEKLDTEVAALKAAQVQSTPVPAGSCDTDVSRIATRRGGERFAASDFSHALAYYQDALTACPGSARAELNLARTCEAMGQRADAIAHYQNAAKGGGEGGDEAAKSARDALSRLGVS